MARLQGPKPQNRPYPLPDLGLSPTMLRELEKGIRQIQFRWKPMTDSPEGLVKDLYELIAWVLDGEHPPTCPRLKEY